MTKRVGSFPFVCFIFPLFSFPHNISYLSSLKSRRLLAAQQVFFCVLFFAFDSPSPLLVAPGIVYVPFPLNETSNFPLLFMTHFVGFFLFPQHWFVFSSLFSFLAPLLSFPQFVGVRVILFLPVCGRAAPVPPPLLWSPVLMASFPPNSKTLVLSPSLHTRIVFLLRQQADPLLSFDCRSAKVLRSGWICVWERKAPPQNTGHVPWPSSPPVNVYGFVVPPPSENFFT